MRRRVSEFVVCEPGCGARYTHDQVARLHREPATGALEMPICECGSSNLWPEGGGPEREVIVKPYEPPSPWADFRPGARIPALMDWGRRP